MTKPKVGLIILNYNSKSFLEDCLDSLKKQTYPAFDIIVVDNASRDDSVTFVKENYPEVVLVENEENVGVGKAFNDIIREKQGDYEYLVLLNPDIRAKPDWLEELVRAMEKDVQAEICASFILNWEGDKVDTAGGTIINLPAGVFGGFLGGCSLDDVPSHYLEKPFPVFFAVVTAMLVRAGSFQRFGFFDEDYFMYFEDIDFSWRVLLGGGEILCNPRAVVYHYGHGSRTTKDISLKLLKKTESNLLSTYYKNLTLLNFILVSLPLVILRSLASLFYLPISPRITAAKLRGVLEFFEKLARGDLRKKEREVSKLRARSDREVLSKNSLPLISFSPLLSLARRWFGIIGAVYHQK